MSIEPQSVSKANAGAVADTEAAAVLAQPGRWKPGDDAGIELAWQPIAGAGYQVQVVLVPTERALLVAPMVASATVVVNARVDATRPGLPFTLRGASAPDLWVSGRFELRTDAESMQLWIVNLQFPGGRVSAHQLD